MTLKEAIQQLVNLGEKRPGRIAELVMERHPSAWLRDELDALASEIISERAQRVLAAERRATDRHARRVLLDEWIGRRTVSDCSDGTPRDHERRAALAEMLLHSEYVPSLRDWKRRADLSAAECFEIADAYDVQAEGNARSAAQMREWGEVLEQTGKGKLGDALEDILGAVPA